MKKYNENMEHREYMFDEERKMKLDKAKKENDKKKNENEESVEYDEEHRKKFSEFRNILNEKDALMTGGDPWLERKEAELKANNGIENDTKTEEECVLKDEDVEQNIEIDYTNTEPTPEPALEPTPEPALEPTPEPTN